MQCIFTLHLQTALLKTSHNNKNLLKTNVYEYTDSSSSWNLYDTVQTNLKAMFTKFNLIASDMCQELGCSKINGEMLPYPFHLEPFPSSEFWQPTILQSVVIKFFHRVPLTH